jgi:ABC-type nitrate/sulfonate/bicarbonate transport system permease component
MGITPRPQLPLSFEKLRLQQLGIPVLVLAALTVIWEVLVRLNPAPFHVIPAPSEVLEAIVRTQDILFSRHIPQTMLETLIGLVIALILGVGLAALLDFSPTLKNAVYPLLVVSQTIPIVALAALLIIIFGFGIEPKVVVVVLFCFFPISISTIDGLTATDPDLVALLRAMGASRGQIWRKVRFPAALPSLFSGLRIAATYSVTGAIVGEYITSQFGLGQYLRSALSGGQGDQAFASIVITSLLSIVLVALVGIAERIALPWYLTQAREAQWTEPGIY